MSVHPRNYSQCAKDMCARLGIKYETRAKDQELRDLVLFHLSRDTDKLTALASRGGFSLYDLSINNLLPTAFRNRVRENAPSKRIKRIEGDEYLERDIGQLSDSDCARFLNKRLVGREAMSILTIVRDIYAETNGFLTLLRTENADLSAAKKIALISRITGSVCTDPKMQRRLLAMFPDPAP